MTAPSVTACVPTYNRTEFLVETLTAILAGTRAPSEVLVSEGSAENYARTCALVAEVFGPRVRVLPLPPDGSRTGNRNWLAAHASGEVLLFVDDDLLLHPQFLEQALDALTVAGTVAVSAGAEGGDPWATLNRRGFYKVNTSRDEQVMISFATCCVRKSVYCTTWMDERIKYGYEDADFTLRLNARREQVTALPLQSIDRQQNGTVGLTPVQRRALTDSARLYVGVRRYWGRRWRLVSFVALELGANVMKRRKPLPSPSFEGQWRLVATHVLLRRTVAFPAPLSRGEAPPD